jgi:hypothetical protein
MPVVEVGRTRTVVDRALKQRKAWGASRKDGNRSTSARDTAWATRLPPGCERGIAELEAEIPVAARLPDQIHASLSTLALCAEEQPGYFEHLEFGVHGPGSRRIAERCRKVFDADDSVALGDSCTHLKPVLRAPEDHA